MVLSEARVWRGAMALLGCPREHTVAHETFLSIPPKILTLEPVRAALQPANVRVPLPDFAMVRRAYAACKFRCSAANVSPFFHRIRAMAAILRASVRRAMAGSIPLATRIS
jgi:hypothetical protein